jgi:hypothetical protein
MEGWKGSFIVNYNGWWALFGHHFSELLFLFVPQLAPSLTEAKKIGEVMCTYFSCKLGISYAIEAHLSILSNDIWHAWFGEKLLHTWLTKVLGLWGSMILGSYTKS